jgi:hypothetical protein
MMTRQAYRELLIRTSAEGNFPAFDLKTKQCSYRAPDGRRCAIGLILPDEINDGTLPNKTADSLFFEELDEKKITPQSLVEGLTSNDMYHIQRIHDGMAISYDETTGQYVERPWNHDLFVKLINDQFDNIERRFQGANS